LDLVGRWWQRECDEAEAIVRKLRAVADPAEDDQVAPLPSPDAMQAKPPPVAPQAAPPVGPTPPPPSTTEKKAPPAITTPERAVNLDCLAFEALSPAEQERVAGLAAKSTDATAVWMFFDRNVMPLWQQATVTMTPAPHGRAVRVLLSDRAVRISRPFFELPPNPHADDKDAPALFSHCAALMVFPVSFEVASRASAAALDGKVFVRRYDPEFRAWGWFPEDARQRQTPPLVTEEPRPKERPHERGEPARETKR
jgi:hypothetical protein